MDKTKYTEALKEVKSKKSSENYVVIQFSYDSRFILPHKAGIDLLNALEQAEQFKDSWNDNCRIIPLERDALTMQFISQKEYQDIKIANLLGVTLKDIQGIHAET